MHMYERFTDRACKLMQLANQEAIGYNREYIAPEHILLGFIKEDSEGADVLRKLGIDPSKVRLAVEQLIETGREINTMAGQPNTPGTMRVIEYAIEETRNLDHTQVEPVHILLGLLREGLSGSGGIIGTVLQSFKLRLEAVRAEARKLVVVDSSSSPENVATPEVQTSEQALIGFCVGVCADTGLGVESIARVYKLLQQTENNQRFAGLVASIRSQLCFIE